MPAPGYPAASTVPRYSPEQHGQLKSIAAGVDPILVKEVVEELRRGEREIREHADALKVPLRHGDPQDQRKIFNRTIRSVT